MDQAKELVDKLLSNQLTGFFFVVTCAVGAVAGIAGTYWVAYQVAILVGAY
jgi:hypothetical protein